MYVHDRASAVRQRNVLLGHYRLVDRVECPVLIDEVEAGCQISILTIIVGWRVGESFENYFLSCRHVLEFKFGRMIS